MTYLTRIHAVCELKIQKDIPYKNILHFRYSVASILTTFC